MKELFSSSILLSIFVRKGGEGIYTRVIEGDNNAIVSKNLDSSEKGLVLYYKNESEWLVLSNKNVISSFDNSLSRISLESIQSANMAIKLEYLNGVRYKDDFTKIIVKDFKGNEYLLKVEKGEPYLGIYQTLSFVANRNEAVNIQ